MAIRRIGLMTGGGDCPGLNAVIRAVTKSAIFDHHLEVIGIADGFLGLIENRLYTLTPQEVSNILTRGGTILGTSNKATPKRFVVGHKAGGEPIVADVTDKVMQHIAAHQLDAIITIGGDGTMTAAADLANQGIPVIGVPKTIDNDLMHSEITFGFQTAVETATEAIDRLHSTAASHHRVMFVETMGRNAGWLCLHAGIAGGADVILIPEIPYRAAAISHFCLERVRQGKAATIVAVSEGALPEGGTQVVDQMLPDSPDPIRLGGISRVLAREIEKLSGLEVRNTILGHVQRGGTPCAYDRVLATMLGYEATRLLMSGKKNQMVAVQGGQMTHVSIFDVAGQQRTVPADAPQILAARAVATCFGDQ